MDKYYIYMLKCQDNSIYTGIAKDFEKRFIEHQIGKGAKYTKSRKVKSIEKVFIALNRSEATKTEIFIKKLSKLQKEKIIKNELNIIDKIKLEIGIIIEERKI